VVESGGLEITNEYKSHNSELLPVRASPSAKRKGRRGLGTPPALCYGRSWESLGVRWSRDAVADEMKQLASAGAW